MKDDKLLQQIIKNIKSAEDYESENRQEAREDLEFAAGEQWATDAKNAREGRPMLTINRMPQFIKQVTGDIRQNTASIKVRPVDSGADPDTAEVFQGLIRNIEVVSNAKEAYTTAADSQVACGEGHWRILTEWTDDDSFRQSIKIVPVSNVFSVHYDQTAKKKTKEDANWACVTERMEEDAFEAKYPNATVSSFTAGMSADLVSWFQEGTVRIVEYFYKKPEKRILGLFEDGSTMDITDALVPPEGLVRTRTIEKSCVYRVVASGAEILEGPDKWAGKYIPIVRVIGEEIHLGDRVVRHGIIRFAKDSQRAHNYSRSAEIETVALQPKSPWLVHYKGIKGFEQYWKSANTANLPYLPYNFDDHPAGPQRQMPPTFSSGWAQLSAENQDDMKATTGIYDSSLGAKSNETSGRAIAMRDSQSDTGTYVYHDNLRMAIEHTGRILVDLIPKIYENEQVQRILGEDDTEKMVVINQMLPDGTKVNDLTVGKYDVTVSIGPAYSTKRLEAADSMLQAAQSYPPLWEVAGDLMAKNWDWPYADEIASRLKKALPPGIAEEDEDDPTLPYKQQIQQMQQVIEQLQRDPEIQEKRAKTEKTAAETRGIRIDNAQKRYDLAEQSGMLQETIKQAVLQALVEQQTPRYDEFYEQ